MASTTTKNIILSQSRLGQSELKPFTTLNHTSTHDESTTTVKIEVPGVDPATVGVNCDNNLLHVECERGELSLNIDPTVDISKIKADIQWGMLTVVIPAPSKPAAQNIKINIHDGVDRKPAHKSSTEKFTASSEK